MSFAYYLITRIDSIKGFLSVFDMFALIGLAIYAIVVGLGYLLLNDGYNNDDFEKLQDLHNKAKKFVKIIFWVTLVTMILSMFIPSSKEALVIFGLDKVETSPQINELFNLIFTKVVTALKGGG